MRLIRDRSLYKEEIHFLNGISTAELKGLYQKAILFLNTSSYEGFGFTPVEAVSQGCPSFLYPNKLVRELFGEHPYLIDSAQADVWADKIVTEMEKQFPDKIKKDRLDNFSWEYCAAQFKNVIKTL